MYMIKIIFTIDENQDSRNWDRVFAIKNLPYGLIKKRGSIKNKKIKDFSGEELKELQTAKKKLEKYFNKDGQAFFKVIEKITARPIYTKEFYASFTSAGLRPYDTKNNWFMVSATEDFSRQLTGICHELLHLQVSHYYGVYCLKNGLNEKQFLDLNEALTFLLNESKFKKYSLMKDGGYPKHKNLRKNLAKFWGENKDFKKLIDNAIEKIKNSSELKS